MSPQTMLYLTWAGIFVIGFIIIAIRKSAQRSPSKDLSTTRNPFASRPLPENDLADKVQSLKNTNSVIRALSILGGLILIVVGMVGDCVEDCSGGYFSTPVMEPSIELVALGVTSLLFSTLIAQIVSLFAAHVEASHKA